MFLIMASASGSLSVPAPIPDLRVHLFVVHLEHLVEPGKELSLLLALGVRELEAMIAHEDPEVIHGRPMVLVEIDKGWLDLVRLEHLDDGVELSQGRLGLDEASIGGVPGHDLIEPV